MLSQPLVDAINNSIPKGVFPDNAKMHLFPLLTNNPMIKIKSQISVLNTFSKIYESVIKNQLISVLISFHLSLRLTRNLIRSRSGAAATSKMERFVIIVNGFQWLTIITNCSILDVAAALDPPVLIARNMYLLLIARNIYLLDYLNNGEKILTIIAQCVEC